MNHDQTESGLIFDFSALPETVAAEAAGAAETEGATAVVAAAALAGAAAVISDLDKFEREQGKRKKKNKAKLWPMSAPRLIENL